MPETNWLSSNDVLTSALFLTLVLVPDISREISLMSRLFEPVTSSESAASWETMKATSATESTQSLFVTEFGCTAFSNIFVNTVYCLTLCGRRPSTTVANVYMTIVQHWITDHKISKFKHNVIANKLWRTSQREIAVQSGVEPISVRRLFTGSGSTAPEFPATKARCRFIGNWDWTSFLSETFVF